MESEMAAKLILCAGTILLRITIVYGFLDCIMHEIYGVREKTEDNVIIRISPMCMFVQPLRDNNPRKKCI